MIQVFSQLLSAALGSVGFGLIFNLNRRYLPAAGVGGLLAWLAYLLAANTPAQRLSCQSVGRFLCRSVCRNSCPMLQCTLYAFLHHRCHSPHSRKHPLLLHERSRLQ